MPYKDKEVQRKFMAERQTIHRQKIHSIINAHKDQPCTDCGVCLPVDVMELDHVRGAKLFTIAQWNKGALPREKGQSREDAIRNEIAKCDVRCPNCHKLRHYYERIRSKEETDESS